MSALEEITNNSISASSQQKFIEKANRQVNPMVDLPQFLKYDQCDCEIEVYCRRKADMDPKILKWAFKLAEKNVGPQYKSCSLGWQPKVKQSDLNKTWARYLVALDRKTKKPVAYTMFRFDLDYGRSVLYCYEMQVETEFQRKGLGGFMMRALEAMARFYSMERVVLTVLKNNEDGMRFYRNLGYDIDETSPDKADNAAYEIMSKCMS
ncbi:N-alpha-acetyltransferase 40 [Toxorhynchites rutilus septentrionalis]|uniref:N-alpha-acetyltransferase 40 n=1 Tax=Toxorhynchites rutilus septentrionalis TaxID=329112 RepID=UPI002478F5C2|nr:N-alpha-acetyltransferase 40 [Toxorhynchites rutilus septentrionalis]